jgi:hypothetical protein
MGALAYVKQGNSTDRMIIHDPVKLMFYTNLGLPI